VVAAAPIAPDELIARFPGVLIDLDNYGFYQARLERRLVINRCGSCHAWHHPPKPICPTCWSRDVQPTEISGRGTVHLLIFLHQGPPAPGVDYTNPHPVATVELVEQPGLRFTTTIIGAPNDQLRIGMPVQLDWIERAGNPFPVFRPTST
jgi:uncharacterized OB-fold protein